MKQINIWVAALLISVLLAGPAFAADKNCCDKAKAEGKPCPHKCCVAAKKDGRTCEKCSPKKKDDSKKREGQNK